MNALSQPAKRMRFSFGWIFVLMTSPVLAQSPEQDPSVTTEIASQFPKSIAPWVDAAIKKWDQDIRKLEAKAIQEADSPDNILMVGSSSIRLWEESGNIGRDMAPFRVTARGYGGAKYTDLAVFAERLIRPEAYRALVLFVGNDVAGSSDDRSVEQVSDALRHIIRVAQEARPESPILIIEVTATPSRYAARDALIALNAMLRRTAIEMPHVYFLPTWEHFLSPAGKPRETLFRADRLHLNEAGYQLWSHLIRDRLTAVLRLESETTPKK